MSDIVWGSVLSKPRGRAKADAPINLADRHRVLMVDSTGIIFEQVSRGSGMMRPVTDPKVLASFLPTGELRERYEAQVAAEEGEDPANPESAT